MFTKKNWLQHPRTASMTKVVAKVLGVAMLVAGVMSLKTPLLRLEPVAAQQAQVTLVNAASFGASSDSTQNSDTNLKRTVAPDSIAALFGTFVTQNNQVALATTTPLPTTLGGVTVRINGVVCPLFGVSSGQINIQIPTALNDSANATIVVTNSDNTQRTGSCIISRTRPGLFSSRATGAGTAAGSTFDGASFFPIANADGSERDVNVGTTAAPIALSIFGTGIRLTPAANPNDGNGVAESVSVTLQGVPLQVLYAGPAPNFIGLDQVNVLLPPEAAGLGIVNLVLRTRLASGAEQVSNTVTIKAGGTLPPVRVTTIATNQTVNGELTATDQIQQIDSGTKPTFFFDGYRFTTTTANATVAVDMRRDTSDASNRLDPTVLIYRITNSSLELIGEDDQSGGYGNGRVDNDNALLLMVLPTPGDYVIFATSSNAQPNGVGKYTLNLSFPTFTQMTYGQNLTSQSIAATDLKTSANTLFDVYHFNAANNDNVEIRMTSSAFASFFILQANGETPATNSFGDATNVGGTATLTRRLTAGTYVILATPYEPNKTGNYSISLNRLSSAAETEAAVAPTSTRRLSERAAVAQGSAARVIRQVEEQ